ncbi:MAG: MFS transporter [Firmicutes bacterium]|nr:MFS transporter [Bacillota bacterium]
MKEILKYRDFIKLFIANLISRFGDSIDMIAYGYMVYKLTGSKLSLATIYISNVLPNILFSSFSGTIVDFFSKKKITVLGDVLRGSLVFITAFLYSQNLLVTWHLFFFTFINSTIETFVSPCKFSTIPKLIDEKHYLTINSSLKSITKFIELIGLAIAGTIIGFIGISGAIVIDGVTFLISSLIICFVKFPIEESKKLTKNNYIKSYKKGMNFVFEKKFILSFIISLALLNFLLTPINALAPAYIKDILKMGPEGLSYFSLSFAMGSILGGIVVSKIGKNLGIKKMLFVGLFFTGLFYSSLSLPAFKDMFRPIILACFSMGLIGIFIPFATAALTTFLMTVTPKDMLARVGAVINMFSLSANPLGAFTSGLISSFIGLKFLILGFGILFMITTLLPVVAYSKYQKDLSQDIQILET